MATFEAVKLYFALLFTLSAGSLILLWLIWLVVGVGIYFLTKNYVRAALVSMIKAEADSYIK